MTTPVRSSIFVSMHLKTWPRGYKTSFMLNSTEHEIVPVVGTLAFMCGENSILGLSEP